jgi:hypothetical protein
MLWLEEHVVDLVADANSCTCPQQFSDCAAALNFS